MTSATSTPPTPTIEEMALQIGLDTVPSSSPSSDEPFEGDSDALDHYFESEGDDPSPEDFTTKPAFYNTGVSKVALVGGVSLVLFLGVAAIFNVASPGGKTEVAAVEVGEEAPVDPTLVALRESQAAESKAKAKLALLAQKQAQGEAPEDGTTEETTEGDSEEDGSETKLPIAKAKPTPVAPPSAPPPPAKITPAPTYSTVKPTTSVAPPPPPPTLNTGLTQRLTPARLPAPVAAVPTQSMAPIQPVDQMAEWQRLAAAGSYGEVSPEQQEVAGGADANARVAALFPGAEGWGGASNNEAVSVETAAPAPDNSALGSSSTAAPLEDYFNAGRREVQLVSHSVPVSVEPAVQVQHPERTILVGSSGQGHLVTPVIWAPNGSRGEARFIVTLSQPILDAQGQPALPEDTQFVVAAQNLDPDSGLVDLTVTALLIEGQEYEAPEGIFSVRDRQGGLLLGQLRNQPNQGRGDTVRVLTGALAQVGRLLNRPRSTSTSSSSGSFGSSQSSTTENSDPNYVGAVLEGGFEEFASVIEERQQAAAEALAEAPQLYQLEANHPIQIFVNQSLSL